MNVKDVIKENMEDKGYTYKYLAEKCGYKTASGVSERIFKTENPRIDVIVKILNAMDCEVVIRSKTSDKKEWVIK